MRPNLLLAVAVVLIAFGAPHAAAADDARDTARRQVRFGIDVALRGLWNEAAYRFERATTLDPAYAAAYNNLAIAYEQLGRLDEARRLYERAAALDHDNLHIRRNVELFVDIDDKRVRPVMSLQGRNGSISSTPAERRDDGE